MAIQYDRMTVDLSIKPAFNGLEAKETKTPFSVDIESVQSKRLSVLASPDDPCKEFGTELPIGLDLTQVAFISFKLSASNPKGLKPLLIGKDKFTPQKEPKEKSTTVFKLENDPLSFLTTGQPETDKALGMGVPEHIYIYNPNSAEVALDVKLGMEPPTDATKKEKEKKEQERKQKEEQEKKRWYEIEQDIKKLSYEMEVIKSLLKVK